MDTKRMIPIILVMMVLVVLWQPAVNWIGTKLGYDMHAVVHQDAATQPSDSHDNNSSVAPTPNGSTQPTMSGAAPAMSAGRFTAVPATQPSSVEIGAFALKDPTYPIGLRISSRGAGLNAVVLNDFKQSVDGTEAYTYQQPYEGFENRSRPLATRSVTIDGVELNIEDRDWQLVSSSTSQATLALDIADSGGKVVARLSKIFQVLPRKDASGGFEIHVEQKIDNRTDQPLQVSTTFNGPNTPPREIERGSDRSIVGGYQETAETVLVDHHFIEEFSTKQPTREYTVSEKNKFPLLWTGTSSVYFDALFKPEPLNDGATTSSYLGKVSATSLNPDASDSKTHEVSMMLQTKTLAVPANGSLSLTANAFFGPKQRALLNNSFYAAMPRMYDATLVMTSGYCGICTFQWLINILVSVLNFFHYILFKDWGLAIIALVFSVRFLLHPITKRSQMSMMKMGKMGPEVEKLKKKYGDDKDGLNKAMMQFYKEQGATPVLGCLPMFLQMPIWIALWSALQSTFELRQAPFLHFFGIPLTWIHDLSQPDHLISLAHPINLFGLIPISGLNLLPIFLGGVFFLQQKYTPKPPASTPEQAQQQKMMQWMSLLFPVMLYAGPSGLNLYIFTSTTFGIIESKVIRDHIKEREEAEKAGRVYVDAGKKFGSARSASGAKVSPEKPAGGITAWFANLQAKAEQMRRENGRDSR